MLPLGDDAAPDEALLGGLPRARRGHGRLRREGPPAARRGRRARLHARLAGDDARDLGRSRAIPRDVLAPLPGRLDARRLGVGRRRRVLVPARPLGRHAQHRGQADRARRARVGGGRPPGDRRGGRDRRAARGEGRGRLALLRARPRRRGVGRGGRRARWRTSSARRSRRIACIFVSALPKTRSAKIVRRAVRARRSGRTPATSRRSRTPRRSRRSHVPSDRLEGVALVTGGGRGIGASIARELADAGMRVAVTGRTARAGRGRRGRDRRARARRRRLAARRRRALGRDAPSASSARSSSSWRTRGSRQSAGPSSGGPGGVVARLRGQRARRAPLLPRGRPADARARRRPDRDHRQRRLPTCRGIRSAPPTREQGGARAATARRSPPSSRAASPCSSSARASCARR